MTRPELRSDVLRAAAATAALAGGAAALRQLLYGWHWFLLVVVTGVLVSAIGVAGRAARVPAPIVAVVQVVTVGLLATVDFARGAAVAGFLPGPAAWASLADTIRTGTDAVNHYAPPAPALSGIELLLVLGSGAAAIALDVLISRGVPALTGLVVLALEAVTACCLPAGIDTMSFLLGGTGWVLVLLAPPRPVPARVAEPPAPTVIGSGLVGRRTALTSLGLAALVPVVVPGLSSGRLAALFSGDAGGNGTGTGGGQLLTVRNPLVELRRNLVQPADVEVLRYGDADTDGQYLRLATLDVFDGETWSARPHAPRQRIDDGITPAEGLTTAVPREAQTTSYSVADGLASRYLPVPYPPTRIRAEGGWWFEPAGLDVVSYGWEATGGFDYTVASLELSFDPAALRAAGPAPAAVRARDLALPPLPAFVERMMRGVVAGAKTDFDRAVALQEWFRGTFTYDTSIVDTSSTGAIVRFLASQRGYCEQFSATMAVMARQLGIPARVVVGFLPGTRPNDQWIVTAHEAHAWPELYFSGSGWVRFEPTPATQTGSEPAWTAASTILGGGSLGSDEQQTVPRIVHRPVVAPSTASTAAAAPVGGGGGGHGAGVATGVAALAVVGLAAPAAVAGLTRERRWRLARRSLHAPASPVGSPTARSIADAVQGDLADTAWEYVGGWAPATTPRQIGERLQRALQGQPEAAAAAARLVELVERVRFAAPGTPVPAADPDRIREDSDLVRHALSARRSRWARLRAAVLPVSVRRRLLPGGRSAAAARAAAEQAATDAAALTRFASDSVLPDQRSSFV